MDDGITLVPSSATLQRRNHEHGDSGNLALLLHTLLDPVSFLTKSLIFFFFGFFLVLQGGMG